ncbi:MAG TPA: N-acetylmuramoyl-L-alanine amidase [Candidatus Udaeobacter sp.]|nr:N-acetylmuramoyl-L-alanine amidase [Candidatus Udaeobacter sp.]
MLGIRRCLPLVLIALLLDSAAWGKAAILQIRLGVHPNSTRVVLELSEAVAYRVGLLAAPPRISIELPATAETLGALPAGRGLALRLVGQQEGAGLTRIEVLLAKPAVLSTVSLIAGTQGEQSRRLVVDFKAASSREFATALATSPQQSDQPLAAASTADPNAPPTLALASPPAAAVTPAAPLSPELPTVAQDQIPLLRPEASAPGAASPAAESPANALPVTLVSLPAGGAVTGANAAAGTEPGDMTYAMAIWPPSVPILRPDSQALPLVYIDPGHGGADPGTIGPDGVYEKTITLEVAQELQRQLIASGRYRAKLTRYGDQYVPLRPRFEMARDDHADLFISLHVNSALFGNPRGLSVYTLSETGSDSEADALAAKENKADLISGVDLTNQTKAVTSILIDLAQRESKNLSARFAELLLHDLGQVNPLLINSHRFAGFAVLKAPDIASVLIELGYISNAGDEALLLSEAHRAKLAAAMLRAIDDYFTTVASRS